MKLASNFNKKDMGEVNVNLGIKITNIYDGLMLSQEHYVEKLLKRFGYYNNKLISTLYDANTQLKKNVEHCGSSEICPNNWYPNLVNE